MNRDPEAILKVLAWLLQDPNPTVSEPSGGHFSQGTDPDRFGAVDPQLDALDPLDSEEIAALPRFLNGLSRFPLQESSLLRFGDIPAVQDRFHALLKRRLMTEIERNPPLFPWETEIYDYDSESPDWVTADLVPASLGITQLHNLNLPVPMPETLLKRLLEQCQTVIQSSLQEGAKLVQAVESLFPGQAPALNQLAGMVLASPSRSGSLSASRFAVPASDTDARSGKSGFPSHYDAATPAQQMALTLIAAREIIESLTFRLSAVQLRLERHLQTNSGELLIEADYQPTQGQRLRIQAQLPCKGRIQLHSDEAQAVAQRSTPGMVSVELSAVRLKQPYSFSVQLEGSTEATLLFAVQLTDEQD